MLPCLPGGDYAEKMAADVHAKAKVFVSGRITNVHGYQSRNARPGDPIKTDVGLSCNRIMILQTAEERERAKGSRQQGGSWNGPARTGNGNGNGGGGGGGWGSNSNGGNDKPNEWGQKPKDPIPF